MDEPRRTTLDIAISAALLVVFSPLLAAIAVAIWLSDGGSVFYRQRRMGAGREFKD